MSLSRRHFLQTTAAATTLSALGSFESVHAQEQPRSKSPGEKIGIAVIGVRGRGRDHIADYLKLEDAEILYIADCDENFGRTRADEVGAKQGRKPQFVQDFRKCLEDPAVDVISTATPNHWHALVSIWGMQAGKDVYVEKPVSHNVWEGRQMVNAARSLNHELIDHEGLARHDSFVARTHKGPNRQFDQFVGAVAEDQLLAFNSQLMR